MRYRVHWSDGWVLIVHSYQNAQRMAEIGQRFFPWLRVRIELLPDYMPPQVHDAPVPSILGVYYVPVRY